MKAGVESTSLVLSKQKNTGPNKLTVNYLSRPEVSFKKCLN